MWGLDHRVECLFTYCLKVKSFFNVTLVLNYIEF